MNTFILRWNPAVSSYKMKHHKAICKNIESGNYFSDWSIHDWEKLEIGDAFILCQVGTKKDGIAAIGKFISKAYEKRKRRGDKTKAHYADEHLFYNIDRDKETLLSAENLEKEFPDIDWHGGHSGILLDTKTANALIAQIDTELKTLHGFEKTSFSDFLKNDNRFLPIDPEEKKEELLALLAPYNPVVHTGEEDGWDWFFDNGEFAIEIKNPCSDSEKDNICITFDDPVGYAFSLYFAGWHTYFKMIENDYAEFLKLLKSILENKVCVLKAYDKDSEIDAVVTELLPANQSKVKVSYWDSNRSFEAKL